MKMLYVFLSLVAVIGGIYMLISNEPDSWMFGIPLLAIGLTALWGLTGFVGLKK